MYDVKFIVLSNVALVIILLPIFYIESPPNLTIQGSGRRQKKEKKRIKVTNQRN